MSARFVSCRNITSLESFDASTDSCNWEWRDERPCTLSVIQFIVVTKRNKVKMDVDMEP